MTPLAAELADNERCASCRNGELTSRPWNAMDKARIPVKLHRRVCLVQTEDAVLAEELLARKKLAQDVVGRLTDRVLLVRPGRVEAVVQELQKMGHTPQVVEQSVTAMSHQPPNRLAGPRAPDAPRATTSRCCAASPASCASRATSGRSTS